MKPCSHCPLCKKPILWYDNVPILSFLFLTGRCRFCRERISFQYPIVELLSALVFLTLYHYYKFSLDFFIYAVFACGLIVSTFIDMRWRIIPDEISLGGIAAGLLFSLIKSFPNFAKFPGIPLVDSLLGAFSGAALIYGSGVLGNLLFFKLMKKDSIEGETESIGGGDVKLLAMIGSFLGWKLAILTFFLAPCFGAVYGIIEKLRTKDTTIAYGPFLVAGALISLFKGDTLIGWMMHGFVLY